MIYKDSIDCQQQLVGIEAIDYFFASTMAEELQQPNNSDLFHCLLALQGAIREGHSCLPITTIADKYFWNSSRQEETNRTAEARNQHQQGYLFNTQATLIEVLKQAKIAPTDQQGVIFDGQRLYHRRYWQYEQEVSVALKSRISFSQLSQDQCQLAKNIIAKLFQKNQSNNYAQIMAVANALASQFSLISGGPGTGKTYTITRVLVTLQAVFKKKLSIKMAAPTGKAAQRLKESIAQAKQSLHSTIDADILNAIPEQAQTIHRLLGIRPMSTFIQHHEDNLIACDVLLIDEASMIDLPMMARILRALPATSTLILLGDVNQLPSVDIGNILADISIIEHPGYTRQWVEQTFLLTEYRLSENNNSHYNYLSYLDKSFRFSGDIGYLAKEVINGLFEQSWSRLLNNTNNSEASSLENMGEAMEEVKGKIQLIKETLFPVWLENICINYYGKLSQASSLEQAFKYLADFRILVPTRIGQRGVIQLNQQIEKYLQKNIGSHYKGCPIMVVENNYSVGLFNGDIGLIWPDENNILYAWFEQEQSYRKISLARLPKIETVYAMTIHKTQGSEFNHIAIILGEKETNQLNSKLLYTAITRAKQSLSLFCSKQSWKNVFKGELKRHSGLSLG